MALTMVAEWLNTAFAGYDLAILSALHELAVLAGWFFTPAFVCLLYTSIPDSVHMLGTLRTVSEKTRDRMKKRIAAIAERIAEGFGGTAKVRFLRGVPSVYNDPALTEELVGYIEGEAIAEVELLEKPLPGSDDMSVISQAVPTSYFVLGAGSAEEGCAYPVHSPHVVFDESVFPQGSALAVAIAMRWLENRGGGERLRGRARLAD